MKLGLVLAALAALLVAAPAAAGPRTINDCEAIKDPGAYNLCLASFGPVRGQHGATCPGVATEGGKSGDKAGGDKADAGGATADAPAASGAHHGRSSHRYSRHGGHGYGHGHGSGGHGYGSRSANGRIRMEFSPGQ